jgi:hypothetical protein
VTGGHLEVTGTWSLNADGTYSDSTRWTGEERFALGVACRYFGELLGCERFDEALRVQWETNEGLAASAVTCVEDDAPGGWCTCTTVIEHTRIAESGTCANTSNRITTAAGAELSYCVEGNSLSVTPERWAPGTSATPRGAVVLQR